MKRSVVFVWMWIAWTLLAVSGSAFASQVYVTARISPLFQEASPASQRLATTLRRGDRLTHLDTQRGFARVALRDGAEGWIPERFVSTEQPRQQERPELANLESRTARRRANSYTTSAAAARGLQDDNERARENVSFDTYDLRAAEWLHGVTRIHEREVVDFAERHEIGF